MKPKMIAAFSVVLLFWIFLSNVEDVIWPAWFVPLILPAGLYVLHNIHHRCPECGRFDALQMQNTLEQVRRNPNALIPYICRYCHKITHKVPGYAG